MKTLNSKFICRKAVMGDDPQKIAQYLHQTDPYIFPKICDKYDNKAWQKFIEQAFMIKNHVFSLDNISLILDGEEIIGLACVLPCDNRSDFSGLFDFPSDISETLSIVWRDYFNPLIEETLSFGEGYNVINFCIDERYRGMGCGSILMEHCIREYGMTIMHLDVIKENEAAVRLYQKHGFTIVKEYMGYSGSSKELPCYHMVRK